MLRFKPIERPIPSYRWWLPLITAILINQLWTPRALAQAPADFDLTFNGTGIVTTSISSVTDFVFSVTTQPDDKIVVAGISGPVDQQDFAVARYDVDGNLDPAFNSTGVVTTPIGAGNDFGRSVDIQADGKIVVAGSHYMPPNFLNTTVALIRYESDGDLDATFGGTGIVTTPIGANSVGSSVVVQPDQKIVVAGTADNQFTVVRYDENGDLDATFGGTGIVTTPVDATATGNSMVLQPDGKIVVAGASNTGSNYNVALVRYEEDGDLDPTLNGTGIVTTPIGSGDDFGYAVALQPNGNMVLSGKSYRGLERDVAVLRYETNGNLDLSFNSTGIVTTPLPSNDSFANAVTIQQNGKIIVAGESRDESDVHSFAVLRYLPNGNPDPTFNTTGLITISLTNTLNNVAAAVTLQADGKIIVAGGSQRPFLDILFAVFRLHGDSVNPAGPFQTYLPMILKN